MNIVSESWKTNKNSVAEREAGHSQMPEQPFITPDSDVELKAVKPDCSCWMFP